MERKEYRQMQDEQELEKILRKIAERIRQGGDSIVVNQKDVSQYLKKELIKRGYLIYPDCYSESQIRICW